MLLLLGTLKIALGSGQLLRKKGTPHGAR
jgi:hypothetical protein